MKRTIIERLVAKYLTQECIEAYALSDDKTAWDLLLADRGEEITQDAIKYVCGPFREEFIKMLDEYRNEPRID